MTYSIDKTRETCIDSDRCIAKPVQKLFHAYMSMTRQITKKTEDNSFQWYSQAEVSYPAQQPMPYGAKFIIWRWGFSQCFYKTS